MDLRIIVIALVFATMIAATPILLSIRSAEALVELELSAFRQALADERKAPIAMSGENVYMAWWTNKTTANNNNEEVMFRVSTDGGQTFGDKINLSNTTNSDSWKVEIAAEGDSVVVSWWETNQTDDTPVARISTDTGETFGPFLRLANNGTIGGNGE